MVHEVGCDVPGRVPKCGAIFMSNASTKRECFRRKLLGLPSAQANFVKQIKAGMVLFLFEFEKRELYGVFRACSDGSTNIVPHAFTSSGRQFPAQVRFAPIWYCDPLTEYEFQDAIKENYYSKNKFNFGLSEDQVRRLLHLFSSRKLQKSQRPFQRQVSSSVGSDRSIAGDDDYFPRNRVQEFVEDDRVEEFVEDAKYPGNGRKQDSNRFIKNAGLQNDLNGNCSQGYDILTEPPSVPLDKRRRDDDEDNYFMHNSMAHHDDLDQGQVIHINRPGDSSDNTEREAEGRKFSLSKHIMGSNTGPIASPKYSWESLAKVGRATDNSRFSQGDILGDKYTPKHSFGLATSMGNLENSAIKARRSCDDREYFADFGVENDYNIANCPDAAISAETPLNTLCRLRTSDKEVFFGNDRKGIGWYADYGMGEVRNESDDGNFLRNDRVDIMSENFANHLDCASRANDHDWLLARLSIENGNTCTSRCTSDKTKRVSDEGILKRTDGLEDAYTMQNQSRHSTVSFSQNLETKNSFCQDQPKLCFALPSSMDQKTFDFSCPTYHDAMVTRTVPYNPEVPGVHCPKVSSFAVDSTSRSFQNMSPHQNSNVNCLATSFKRSSPYRSEAENLMQLHDVASGNGNNEAPLPTSPNYYTRSGFRSNTSFGKMEAKATGLEVQDGSLFPKPTSTSPHFLRSDMSRRWNGSLFSQFDKHAVSSQSIYEQEKPQYENNRVGDASVNNSMGYLHSDSSNGKSSDWDTQYYYQNATGKLADSKSKRKSVFARLTSEVHEQESSDLSCLVEEESNFDLQYDECDMGASVDQVMDEIFETLDHPLIKVGKSSLVRKRDMVCDQLKMPTLKMEDGIEHVIEVNWNEIVEETRVVSFKRRSETKKLKDNAKEKNYVDTSGHEREGSVQKLGREGSEGMQHKRRKLVRPVFGRKVQVSEGLSNDGSPNLQASSSGHYCGTGNLDDSAKSRDKKDCKGNNACIKQSLYCQGGKYGNYNREESFDGGTKRDSNTSNLQVLCHEGGFNAEENAGCCIDLNRSSESENISSQDVCFIHEASPTIC